MRWLRVGIILAAACAIWAAPAAACQYPSAAPGGSSAGAGPPSAGPNDPVTVTISNVDEGGRWEVYVDGRLVMAGVGDGSRSVSRSFDMPDLGGESRIVKVTVSIQHEGESWNPPGFDVQYRGTPPPPPPQPAPAESEAAPAPVQETPQEEQHATANERGAGPGPAGGVGGRRGGRTERIHSRGEPVDPGLAAPPVRAAPPAAEHARPSTRAAAGLATRPTEATRDSRAAGIATRQRVTPPDASTAPRRAPASPPRASAPQPRSRAGERGTEVPAIPLVGVALVLMLASAAAGLWWLRRAGGGPTGDRVSGAPPWVPPEVALEVRARNLLIEAELQEMIAEARARELGADREGTSLGRG